MARCMCCNEKIEDMCYIITNLDDFLSHEGCFYDAMNNKYGEGNWWYVDDDGCDGFYMARDPDTGEEFGTGIFCTEFRGEGDDILNGFDYEEDYIYEESK